MNANEPTLMLINAPMAEHIVLDAVAASNTPRDPYLAVDNKPYIRLIPFKTVEMP